MKTIPGANRLTWLIVGLTVAAMLLLVPAARSETGSYVGADTSEGDPFFGIMSQRDMTVSEWNTMEWGRLGSFRLPVDWGSVEREEGDFHWQALDNAMKATASRGIDLLPVLYNTPGWLADDRRRLPVWGEHSIREWRYFLKEAVLRYGSDGTFFTENPELPVRPVEKWQIWNEPNIKYYALPVSPRIYARLIEISARVIRNYDPEAKVVTAGFYATPPEGKGIDAGRYMKRLYRSPGFRSSFDLAAIHPYASTTRESLMRTNPIRRVMNEEGNRARRIMITELGWGSDSATVFGMGSERGQADQLESAYRSLLANRARLKLDSVYWFAWNDLPPGARACAFCLETGLFDYRDEPKPAWFRLLDFTHDI